MHSMPWSHEVQVNATSCVVHDISAQQTFLSRLLRDLMTACTGLAVFAHCLLPIRRQARSVPVARHT